jgi:hypothetical protein
MIIRSIPELQYVIDKHAPQLSAGVGHLSPGDAVREIMRRLDLPEPNGNDSLQSGCQLIADSILDRFPEERITLKSVTESGGDVRDYVWIVP